KFLERVLQSRVCAGRSVWTASVLPTATLLVPHGLRRLLSRGGGGRLRFGVLPLRALNADAGLGSVTDDGRFYGAFRDGGPRPHRSIMRPGPAVAVGPRGSHLGRVLALVRVPRPRRSPGVRGHPVPADAPDAVDAPPLQRHRPAYPHGCGAPWGPTPWPKWRSTLTQPCTTPQGS